MHIVTSSRIFLFLSTIFFTALLSSTASAYIFGPPNITEIIGVGESQSSFGFFSRAESDVFSGTKNEVNTVGLAGGIKTGDQSGSINFQYRLSKATLSSTTLERTQTDFGLGLGSEWNLLSERNLGLFANFQVDFGTAEFTKGSSNTAALSTLGGEIGGYYRFFIETATIAPFILINQFKTKNQVSVAFDTDFTLTNSGRTTMYGIVFNFRNVSLSYTQSSTNSQRSSDASSFVLNRSDTGSFLSLGFIF